MRLNETMQKCEYVIIQGFGRLSYDAPDAPERWIDICRATPAEFELYGVRHVRHASYSRYRVVDWCNWRLTQDL